MDSKLIIGLAIIFVIVFICRSQIDNLIANREGVAPITFNKSNASWMKYGYKSPSPGEQHKNAKQMYNTYEEYWRAVDHGILPIPKGPEIYHKILTNKTF